jgi:DNA invertase Pin-like site-specific DNA recombinase
MTTITTVGAADYGRISDDDGHDEKGVARQSEDNRTRIAREPGWHFAGSFIDNDLSATKGRPRPEFRRLMDAVRRGEVKVIVVYMTGRFVRNRRERMETYEDLARHGVRIVCTKGADLDLSTPAGRMVAGILGEVDAHEVEQAGERIRRSKKQAAEEGRPTGARPYGYRPDPTAPKNDKRRLVVPDEAEVIRALKDAALWGASLRSLVLDLNDVGVPTLGGGPWSVATVRGMLTSPVIAGMRACGGAIVPATWEPVITVGEHHRLVALFSRHAQPEGWSNQHVHLLSGIADCGACGRSRVHGRVDARRPSGRAYVCPPAERGGCRGVRRDAGMVEDLVEKAAVRILGRPGVVERMLAAGAPDADEVIKVQRGIDAAQARAAALGAEMKDDDPDDEVTKIMRKARADAIRADLAALRARQGLMARASVVDGLLDAEDIAAYWPSLSLPRKRAIIAALVDITILPVGRGHRAGKEHIRIVRRAETRG